MKHARIVLLMAALTTACSDSPSGTGSSNRTSLRETVKSGSTLTERLIGPIGESVMADQRYGNSIGLRIGVLSAGATEDSVTVMVAPRGASAQFWRYVRRGSSWVRSARLLGVGGRSTGVTPVTVGRSSVMDPDPIGYVWPYSGGGGPYDLDHLSDVRKGSYITTPQQGSTYENGNFFGGAIWVGDTLFNYSFTKWMYHAGDYYCSFSMKTKTTPSATFTANNDGPGYPTQCGATTVLAFYKIGKAYVPPPSGTSGSGSGSGGPTPTATIYGPTAIKPSASCNWYVSYANVPNATYEWRVNGSPVGTGQDIWLEREGSFELTIAVFNDDDDYVVTTISVNVNSENGNCYVE